MKKSSAINIGKILCRTIIINSIYFRQCRVFHEFKSREGESLRASEEIMG